MPIPVIALLAVGGIALMAASSGGGGGPIRLFDGQCRLIKRTVQNEQQLLKLVAKLASLINRAVSDVTGIPLKDVGSDEAAVTFRSILGDSPGDPEQNVAFIRATVTRAVQISATPACLKKMDVPGSGPQNAFGEDWSEVTLPDDMAEVFVSLTADMMMTLDIYGYNVGVEYARTGSTVPHRALAERITR